MDELTVDMIGQACATFGQIYDIKLCQLLSLWTYAPYRTHSIYPYNWMYKSHNGLLHTNLSPKPMTRFDAPAPCFILLMG